MKITKITENWRPVPIAGFEDLYEVSDQGRLKSLPRSIVTYRHGLEPFTQHRKMRYIKLSDKPHSPLLGAKLSKKDPDTGAHVYKTIYIHKLVAMAFVKNPDPDNLNQVAHIDNDPVNNEYGNLKWVNQSYYANNPNLVYTKGTVTKKRSSLSQKMIKEINKYPNLSAPQVGKKLGISKDSVYKYRNLK